MTTTEYKRMIVSNYRQLKERLSKNDAPITNQPARYFGLIVNVIEVCGESALVGRKDVKSIVELSELSSL